MPSSSSRSRVPTRRSPRPAPRAGSPRRRRRSVRCRVVRRGLRPARRRRGPLPGLAAAHAGDRLGLRSRSSRCCSPSLAVAGAVLVFLGRARGWLLLAVAAALPLVGMLVLAVLFAALGGGLGVLVGGARCWSGPVVALVLALRRPVREWTRPAAAGRSPGGRREPRVRPASVAPVSTESGARGPRPMSSSWGRGWPAWSPPPNSPTPASGWSSSSRSPRRPSAARRGGRFGGLFLIDTPEQRRLRVHDSLELARQDWFGTAGFDRDRGPLAAPVGRGLPAVRGGGEAGLAQGAGHRLLPGGRLGRAGRLHRHRARQLRAALPHRLGHRARPSSSRSPAGCGRPSTPAASSCASGTGCTSWSSPAARSPACAARCSRPSAVARGEASSRTEVGDFEISAQAVVVTAGGIGGNHELVRRNWPARLGPAPQRMLSGVPAHVDGHMLEATEAAGASVVNSDRMWHYTEGIANHSPVWARHGIRILPGPSSLWFDATGKRLPVPLFPGLRHPRHARPHRDDRLRAHLVHRHAQDRREGVRALRLRAEPRPHRQGRQAPRHPGQGRHRRPGAGVPRPGRGLRRRRPRCPSWWPG